MDLFGSIVIGKNKVDNVNYIDILGFRSRMFDDVINKIVIGFI